MKRSYLLVVATLLMLFFSVYVIYILFSNRFWSLPLERRREVQKHAFLKAIGYTLEDLYEKTGILINEEYSICNLSIYPFKECISKMVGSVVAIRATASGDTILFRIIYNGSIVYKRVVVRLDQEEITRRRMKVLLGGLGQVRSFVMGLRREIERYGLHLNPHVGRRSVPQLDSCLDSLPDNSQKLKTYLYLITQWLGSEILKDGFGRPLEIQVQSGRLHIRSAGRDGQYGTADDILGQGQEAKFPSRRLSMNE
jgi:hypothetical protein